MADCDLRATVAAPAAVFPVVSVSRDESFTDSVESVNGGRTSSKKDDVNNIKNNNTPKSAWKKLNARYV